MKTSALMKMRHQFNYWPITVGQDTSGESDGVPYDAGVHYGYYIGGSSRGSQLFTREPLAVHSQIRALKDRYGNLIVPHAGNPGTSLTLVVVSCTPILNVYGAVDGYQSVVRVG